MTKKTQPTTDTPRIGRPPKRPQDRIRTTVRQLGRVDDARWQALKQAAFAAGMSFTEWALSRLEAAAKRELKRKK